MGCCCCWQLASIRIRQRKSMALFIWWIMVHSAWVGLLAFVPGSTRLLCTDRSRSVAATDRWEITIFISFLCAPPGKEEGVECLNDLGRIIYLAFLNSWMKGVLTLAHAVSRAKTDPLSEPLSYAWLFISLPGCRYPSQIESFPGPAAIMSSNRNTTIRVS